MNNTDLRKNYTLFNRLLLFSIVISVANVSFAFNKIIAVIIVFIQAIILLGLVLQRKITDFLAVYVISVSNCLELSGFVGAENFYNMKNLRIAGVNVAIWLLIPAIFVIALKPVKIGLVKKKHPDFSRFSRFLLAINVIAAITGIILIAFNDNNIRSIGNVLGEYIGTAYTMLFLPLCIALIFLYILAYESERVFVMSYALEAVLWGSVAQAIVSYTFKLYGFYGGVNTLLLSNISFIIPMMLLLFLDKKHIVYPNATMVVAVIGTLLVLFNNANGKHIILLPIVGIIIVFTLLRDKSIKTKIITCVLIIAVLFVVPFVFSKLMERSIVFASKFNQAFGLLSFGGSNWLSNVADSPRMRIAQFINIAYEFGHKPWLAIFGKGYLGSVKDYANMFGQQTTGSYTSAEWSAGVFYNLHELSSQLLMFGCLGIICSIYLVCCTLKKYKNNIWLLVGAYWFVVLYGYSFTLSAFCIVALYYGLTDENDDDKLRIANEK